MSTATDDFRQRAAEATPEYWTAKAEAADAAEVAARDQSDAADQEAESRLSSALKRAMETDHSKLEACRAFVQEAKADADARVEYMTALRACRARGIRTDNPFSTFAVRAAQDSNYELRKLRDEFARFGRL